MKSRALPDDLTFMAEHRVEAAIKSRLELLNEVFAEAGDDNDMTARNGARGHHEQKINTDQDAQQRPRSDSWNTSSIKIQPHPASPAQPITSGVGGAFLKEIRKQSPDLKALDATSGGATMPGSFWDRRLRDLPSRNLFVRSLIPSIQTTTQLASTTSDQSVFTNNATPVAAGSAKPTSLISAERVTVPVRVIAHVSRGDGSLAAGSTTTSSHASSTSQITLGVLLGGGKSDHQR